MMRPQRRCKNSSQKMDWNSLKLMPLLTSLYSGNSRYLAKVASHSASFRGGNQPLTGFHSTIDKPEWVSRVTPPNTTMAKTIKHMMKSQ